MPYIDPLGSLNTSGTTDVTSQTETDFTKGVERVVSTFDTLIDSVDDNFYKDLDFDAYEKQFREVEIPDFPVSSFKNLVNVFDNVRGLRLKKGIPQPADFDQNISQYQRLEKNLQIALKQDWKVNGANPLILDAFALSGANFERDGYKGQYNWNVAFVNYILSKSDIDYFQTLGTKAYENYGTSVEYGGRFDRVRKNDLVIMQGLNNIRVMGFVQTYDPAKRTANVIVGNADKRVKLVKNIPFAKNSKELFITNIRRNWQVTELYDLPLYNVKSARSSTDAFESLTKGVESIVDKVEELDVDFGENIIKAIPNEPVIQNTLIGGFLGDDNKRIKPVTNILKNLLGDDSLRKRIKSAGTDTNDSLPQLIFEVPNTSPIRYLGPPPRTRTPSSSNTSSTGNSAIKGFKRLK